MYQMSFTEYIEQFVKPETIEDNIVHMRNINLGVKRLKVDTTCVD